MDNLRGNSWLAPSALPRIFLYIAIPLSVAFALVLPPLQVPDEVAHWFRAYGISEGSCLGSPQQVLPAPVVQLFAKYPQRLEEQRRVFVSEYADLFRTPLWSGGTRHFENGNANIYSCVPYLPAAAAIALGRLASLPAILLFLLGRLVNTAIFIALTYAALVLLPTGRLVLFCLALMPMTLQQAASQSADSMTISTSFVMCAWILYLAFSPAVDRVTPAQQWATYGLLLLNAFCKFNIWLILFVLIIPPRRFASRRQYAAFAAMAIGLPTLASAAWQMLNRTDIERFQQLRSTLDIFTAANASFIVHHPITFLAALARTLLEHCSAYAEQFVGVLGWVSIRLPLLLVVAYLLLLVLASASEKSVLTQWRSRAICAVVLIGSILSLFALLWVFETQQSYIQNEIVKGRGYIIGIQGRYFIPFALPGLLLLSCFKLRLNPAVMQALAILIVLAAGCIALARIFDAYYGGIAPSVTLPAPVSQTVDVGLFRRGTWYLHRNSDSIDFNGGSDEVLRFGGADDVPVVGDWTGDGHQKIGVYSQGRWELDLDGDGRFTANDLTIYFGGRPSDIPVVGDWTGDGRTKIGIYRGGRWLLDFDGKGKGPDPKSPPIFFGGVSDDIPVVGDWDGSGKSKIGVYRRGAWILDWNGNYKIDGLGPGLDRVFSFGGLPGDIPVVGKWNGSKASRIGLYRPDQSWDLDVDGNYQIDKGDTIFKFGRKGDRPVTGRW
jgi:uncharacterized membrane protein